VAGVKRVFGALGVDWVIGPFLLSKSVAGEACRRVEARSGRTQLPFGPERAVEGIISGHRPPCWRGMEPEESETGEVVRSGEQAEVGVEAKCSAHPRAASAVTARRMRWASLRSTFGRVDR